MAKEGGSGRPSSGVFGEGSGTMTVCDITFGYGAAWLRCVGASVLVAALWMGPIVPARADAAPPAGAPTEASVTAFAVHWFTEMQAGRTDRSQYTSAYGTQVTDDAVKAMSHALNQYGATPLRAEIVQTRKIDDQTFYIVKFVFPRGDATSLLFGFDAAGKITGVGVGGMAGD
jgi:hypothetical protein